MPKQVNLHACIKMLDTCRSNADVREANLQNIKGVMDVVSKFNPYLSKFLDYYWIC